MDESESESLEEWEVAILVKGKQEGGIGSSLRMFQIANCFRLKRDKHSFYHVQKLQCLFHQRYHHSGHNIGEDQELLVKVKSLLGSCQCCSRYIAFRVRVSNRASQPDVRINQRSNSRLSLPAIPSIPQDINHAVTSSPLAPQTSDLSHLQPGPDLLHCRLQAGPVPLLPRSPCPTLH